jgi:hypothetical protein
VFPGVAIGFRGGISSALPPVGGHESPAQARFRALHELAEMLFPGPDHVNPHQAFLLKVLTKA